MEPRRGASAIQGAPEKYWLEAKGFSEPRGRRNQTFGGMMENIRSRFWELVDFLKERAAARGVPPENFDAETAKMELASGGHNLTETGWHLANLKYTGAILIERVNRADAVMLMLHVRAWLDDHDDTRDDYKLPDPEVALVPLDAGDLVDLVISCEFVDPVFIVEADDGELVWNGRKFALIDYDLRVVERVWVNQAPAVPEV